MSQELMKKTSSDNKGQKETIINIDNIENAEDNHNDDQLQSIKLNSMEVEEATAQKCEVSDKDHGKLENNKSNRDVLVYLSEQAQPLPSPRWGPKNTYIYAMVDNHLPPTGDTFTYDPETRNGFVRHVFMLVFLMLSFTALCATTSYVIPEITRVYRSPAGLLLFIVATIMLCALQYAIMCSSCTRVVPINYICLLLVSMAMSVIVSYFVVKFKVEIIIAAFAATGASVGLCTMLAYTLFDFTKFLLYIVLISMAVAMLTVMLLMAKLILDVYFKPLHIGLLFIGTILNCITLVAELQMILGGKTVELGEDDYAIGAFMVYISIVDMFLKILQILGLIDSD